MVYAMADLHGCYDKFSRMLERINFSDGDTLYILGDVLDRGADGIKILLEVMQKDNIKVLLGNHEFAAYKMLSRTETNAKAYSDWLSDGGKATADEFKKLDEQTKQSVLSYIAMCPLEYEITVNGNSFLLSHTGSEKRRMADLDRCTTTDFILGEIEYEKVYFADRFFVSGHTPTSFIDENYKGRIYRKNNHIAIDCGAVFGNPLGCICLDTFEEFYCD